MAVLPTPESIEAHLAEGAPPTAVGISMRCSGVFDGLAALGLSISEEQE